MSFWGTCGESIVKYRHAFLTLLDEKQLSKVAADYLLMLKKLGSVYLNLTYLLLLKLLKKLKLFDEKSAFLSKEHKQTRKKQDNRQQAIACALITFIILLNIHRLHASCY